MARRYESFAKYLSDELDVPVEFVPSVDYAAVVTAFSQNELQLAFFEGLTGVQARLQNPRALPLPSGKTTPGFTPSLSPEPTCPWSRWKTLKGGPAT